MTPYLPSLAGGLLIGLSAILYLVLTGRIAGISGILGRFVQGGSPLLNGAFVLGLVLGPVVFRSASGSWPQVTITAGLPLAILAGMLVGIGTRMGSGCTSGHGILGLARLSPRSIAAVVTFLAAGIVTVTLMRGSL
ncbi:YeeE/YedE family protein [Rhizobium sp. SSA_523]|uniref:YeeE/YedE family protein n=1 Tax=Rhizobium sp. SSA_523 TaxID=2952477 RepID=UPI0020905385|nr:YeeE/YedE family protein [Rhizobium sp. SSA_523]MCO5730730.1 YeeE/YedE family protein [Rhizobium sp. SSA_523]WKC24446.1 YeeE/YedE family protein [Rhizobium sp. SSA_523]